jgi:hypothetical protein
MSEGRMQELACGARCDAYEPALPAGTVIFSDRFTCEGTVGARRNRDVISAALAGRLEVLVLDARGSAALSRAEELLRALYDDPRLHRRLVEPRRVLALVDDGDVEAAFALGRFGLGALLEMRAAHTLPSRLEALAARPLRRMPAPRPRLAPARPERLGPAPAELAAPIVAGHAHSPDTLRALARYIDVLQRSEAQSTVFADVATLLRALLEEGLTFQTDLATQAGVARSGQFIGSFEYYRSLRRTRYAAIPEPALGTIEMEVFIAVDEILHEVLHLLFLANVSHSSSSRGHAAHTEVAEELSLTWWQAVVHERVWGSWLADRHILEINDDFTLSANNAQARGFFRERAVFERYASFPWISPLLARLPPREAYIGERPDLDELLRAYALRPEATFLAAAPEHLRVRVPFASYPRVPDALRVPSAVLVRAAS